MLNDFLNLAGEIDAFKQLEGAVKNGQTAALYDLCEGQRPFLACAAARMLNKRVLLVVQNEAAALRMTDDCAVYLDGCAAYFPGENPNFTRATASRETADRRLEALCRVQKGEAQVLVATIDALQTRVPDYDAFARATISLRPGQHYPPDDLMRDLARCGYERVEMVEGKGQCAKRGEIVDVFTPGAQNPYRIEFFDEEADLLRSFDLVSQRSLEKLPEIVIRPAESFLYTDEQARAAAERLRALARAQLKRLPDALLFDTLPPLPEDEEEQSSPFLSTPKSLGSGVMRLLEDADALEQSGALKRANLWAGILTPESASIVDWLGDPVVFIDMPENVRSRANDRRAGFEEDFKLALERREAVPEQAALVMDWDEVRARLLRCPLVLMQDFLRGMAGFEVGVTINMAAHSPKRYLSRFTELAADTREMMAQGYHVLLLSGGQTRGQRMRTALQNAGLSLPMMEEGGEVKKGAPVIFPVSLSHGFVFEDAKLALISDSDIFGAGYKKARKTRSAGEKIEAFTDLKEGDYVVHEAHGVGVFMGTVRLQTEGTYRDYLYIQYRGNDKLYVPTDQFDRVQKYIGGQDTPPQLNSLSGKEWEKQKQKVKAGLKKLAFDLVALYAQRRATPGHAFAPDSPWQAQFEDKFPYELTPDQARAVRDVSQDMEAPLNMDRLVCGDVGYGKTEVALRAAFKAVMDSKQVALLAPTTILAQQHYNTLVKRFEDFPVTVDVLSRFRNKKEQARTLKDVAQGKVDILVGTHRLLSKDVQFKSLGLLIIDEEQRFGVQHKETIKHMKTKVDVLTLSATPIPRTLHMSMVGVRDMSLLETPPEERFPVQTYVIDYQDSVIRDAIQRELNRGGQVYFLYNRVRSIDEFAARLRALLPTARIITAHGQMKEHALEDVMADFYAGRYDVLLSTTIIENGLDVPNANTLIVYDADRFGLSQLYQLRGRVGRSNRVAYAYFTVRQNKMLSEDAQKRLSAIREFTEFGSGFRIAMRDLEIRGAGNIFGPEQSGNVSTVGYDLYVKLIEEAVREAQGATGGEAVRPAADTRVDLKVDAFLPIEYVSGEVQRMEVYKRIALIRSRDDREDVLEELIDRFGEPPAPVMRLIDIAHLRAVLSHLGITRVTYTPGVLRMRVEPALMPAPEALVNALLMADKRLVLSAQREPAILLRDSRLDAEGALKVALPVMEMVLRTLSGSKK